MLKTAVKLITVFLKSTSLHRGKDVMKPEHIYRRLCIESHTENSFNNK